MAAEPATDRVPLDSERHLARVQELTEALEALDDGSREGGRRGPRRRDRRALRRGPAAGRRALQPPGPPARRSTSGSCEDGVVASLLLIHDLYPIDLETRVREALATVRPYMESHGGDVELLGLEDGVARLRLVGHCEGCPASAATLELAIKEAIDEAAPDLAGLEVEGVAAPPRAGSPRRPGCCRSRCPTAADRRRPPTWMALDRAGDVAPGELRTVIAARRRADRRQRRRHATGLSQRLRRLRRRPRRRGAAAARSSPARAAGAGSTCRAPGARWAQSRPSSSRCRCSGARAGGEGARHAPSHCEHGAARRAARGPERTAAAHARGGGRARRGA